MMWEDQDQDQDQDQEQEQEQEVRWASMTRQGWLF